MTGIRSQVDELWQRRSELADDDAVARATVMEAIALLDTGQERVAEIDPATGEVVVNEWTKRAILLLFRLSRMRPTEVGPFEHHDKIPLKRGYAGGASSAVATSTYRAR